MSAIFIGDQIRRIVKNFPRDEWTTVRLNICMDQKGEMKFSQLIACAGGVTRIEELATEYIKNGAQTTEQTTMWINALIMECQTSRAAVKLLTESLNNRSEQSESKDDISH